MADSEVIVYGFCEANCKHRVLTREQTVALIQEMAANGFQVPEGFIAKTAVNAIVEQNTGKEIRLFVGTQAEYDAWTGDKNNVFAIISDDPTLKDILRRLDILESSLVNILDGKTVVPKADSIEKANGEWTHFTQDKNGVLRFGDIVVPQKIKIFEGDVQPTESNRLNLSDKDIKGGDTLEITIKWNSWNGALLPYGTQKIKVVCPSAYSDYSIHAIGGLSTSNGNGLEFYQARLTINGENVAANPKTIYLGYIRNISVVTGGVEYEGHGSDLAYMPHILEIYKVIE